MDIPENIMFFKQLWSQIESDHLTMSWCKVMFMPEAVCDNSHSRQVKESTVQTEVLSSHPHHLPLGLLTVEGEGGWGKGTWWARKESVAKQDKDRINTIREDKPWCSGAISLSDDNGILHICVQGGIHTHACKHAHTHAHTHTEWDGSWTSYLPHHVPGNDIDWQQVDGEGWRGTFRQSTRLW